MSRIARRSCPVSVRLAALAAFAFVLVAGCGSDEATGPVPDQVIRITESNFNPSFLTVKKGTRIEWQNRYSQTRTVTSGTGPDDPAAGDDFDVPLGGYPPGKAVGGTVQMVFSDVDTIRYFNRNLPPGFLGSFTGIIIVTE